MPEWDSDSLTSIDCDTENKSLEVTGDNDQQILVNLSSTEAPPSPSSHSSIASISHLKGGRPRPGLSHAATERIKSANGLRTINTGV